MLSTVIAPVLGSILKALPVLTPLIVVPTLPASMDHVKDCFLRALAVSKADG